MAYLNKIDINGRTYYLQHLTDGKNEAMLPTLTKDSKIIVQDANVYSGNVGDTDTPVYIKDNKVVAFNKDIGNEFTPVYVDYGNIKPLSADIGSTTKPIYMKAGAITASNETVGSGIVPIYMQDGTITASNETVGTNIKLIYMYEGTITESNANVGSGIVPTYMNNGEITASTTTVGSNVKPIYLNAGAVTVSDGNVGAINQPIYMNNGEITACSDSVGNVGVPVYMKNGVITACGTIPITSGGTDATTAEQALKNFGLTATAAELNTLDGIKATVTELNYVDGVTSSIQTQFNNQDKRIKTMETFFKSADIDASQEFIDTLKEIQTYIENDKTGAASMVKSIGDNAAAITKLNGDSTTEGSVAKAVSDAKTVLNAEIDKKVDKVDGKGLSSNDYTDAEKEKLEGIAAGANKYVHPSYNAYTSGLYKITVDEFGHVSSMVAVSKDDIVALGIPSKNTTYKNATTSASGLLSAADKITYDGYAATIESLQSQIDELKALVESYHPTTEPDETE